MRTLLGPVRGRDDTGKPTATASHAAKALGWSYDGWPCCCTGRQKLELGLGQKELLQEQGKAWGSRAGVGAAASAAVRTFLSP